MTSRQLRQSRSESERSCIRCTEQPERTYALRRPTRWLPTRCPRRTPDWSPCCDAKRSAWQCAHRRAACISERTDHIASQLLRPHIHQLYRWPPLPSQRKARRQPCRNLGLDLARPASFRRCSREARIDRGSLCSRPNHPHIRQTSPGKRATSPRCCSEQRSGATLCRRCRSSGRSRNAHRRRCRTRRTFAPSNLRARSQRPQHAGKPCAALARSGCSFRSARYRHQTLEAKSMRGRSRCPTQGGTGRPRPALQEPWW